MIPTCERIVRVSGAYDSPRAFKGQGADGLIGMKAHLCNGYAVAQRGGDLLCVTHWLSDSSEPSPVGAL